jgi:hypothetical protein
MQEFIVPRKFETNSKIIQITQLKSFNFSFSKIAPTFEKNNLVA